METSEDCLLLLYAEDGKQWANFISTRLSAPQYNIKSIFKNITCLATDSGSHETRHSINTSDNSNQRNSNCSQNSGKISHRESIELRDSGRGSRTTINEISSPWDCINSARATIVFLSPDTMSTSPFPFDVSFLNPKRSVFLFLGVDIEEVRSFFGEKSDLVFKCRCCLVDVDEQSVCDAMVQIIEAYEDTGDSSIFEDEEEDEDIYRVPGSPRQLNGIEKVFPQELTEKDRDVYILLQRAAEDDAYVVLNGAWSRKIPLTCVCERLYMFTLPGDVNGDIVFSVECQNHSLGVGSVRAFTNLDLLKAILNEEVNPLSIVASALGLAHDDIGGVDTALAFKIQQLASVSTFQKMFPCEELLNSSVTDQQNGALYPSLLHFAADLNLRTFCSELLRYPGMLAAALMENSQGELPSQIAARKGYALIQSDLQNFVDSHSVDDQLYISSFHQEHTLERRPKAYSSLNKSPHYVNEHAASHHASGLYIDMGNLKMTGASTEDKLSLQSDTDVLSPPISDSSDSVFIRSLSSKDEYGSEENNEKENWCLRLSQEQDVASLGSASNKALRMLGVLEEDLNKSRTSTLERTQSGSGSLCSGLSVDSVSQDMLHISALSQSTRGPLSNKFDDSVLNGFFHHDSKQRTLNKIVSFFGKFKNKRSQSLGDSNSFPSRSLKKSFSNRSDKSTKSAREAYASSRKNKSMDSDNQERDSGSYSDEEKDRSLSGSIKKQDKSREFKDRGKPLARRQSQRVHAASKECVRDAPELPSTVTKKEIFTNLTEQF